MRKRNFSKGGLPRCCIGFINGIKYSPIVYAGQIVNLESESHETGMFHIFQTKRQLPTEEASHPES